MCSDAQVHRIGRTSRHVDISRSRHNELGRIGYCIAGSWLPKYMDYGSRWVPWPCTWRNFLSESHISNEYKISIMIHDSRIG